MIGKYLVSPKKLKKEKDFMKTKTRLFFPKNLISPACAVSLLMLLALSNSQSRAYQSPETSQEGSEKNPRFALSVKEVNLRELLLLLTKNSRYSLIMEPGVDVTIPALDLKGVSLDEVLQSILPNLGLEYRFEGNVLRVSRPGMQTRVYYLNYIAASRSGKRDMNMSSRSQTGGGNGSSGGGGGSKGSDGQSGGSSGGSSTENKSSIITANISEVWTDVRLGLETIVFSGGKSQNSDRNRDDSSAPAATASTDSLGRRLLINPQAGMVMIHAEPSILSEAASYVEAVAGSIQRQVLIEAKVVEVTLAKDYQLGVNWSAVLNPSSNFSGLLPGANGVAAPSVHLHRG